MAKDKVVEQDKQLGSAPVEAPAAELAEEVGLVTTRPTTDANVWIQVIGSVICTVLLCYGVSFWSKMHNAGMIK